VHCASESLGSIEISIKCMRNVDSLFQFMIKLTVEEQKVPGENAKC
jgi:hypothetical protein